MDAATELPVLMALRVRGCADAAQVARAAGCAEAEAVALLARVQARGAAVSVAGSAPGALSLTATGRGELTRLLAAEPLDRATLTTLYDRFLVVDRDLKQAITAWQLADPATRDDTSAALARVATAAGALAAALTPIAPRLAPYHGRIAVAVGAITSGDTRFVVSPRVDSLHQIWFELHEDLLVTLDRSRAA